MGPRRFRQQIAASQLPARPASPPQYRPNRRSPPSPSLSTAWWRNRTESYAVPQIVQSVAVFNFAPENQAFLRFRDSRRQGGIAAFQFIPRVAFQKTGQDSRIVVHVVLVGLLRGPAIYNFGENMILLILRYCRNHRQVPQLTKWQGLRSGQARLARRTALPALKLPKSPFYPRRGQ